MDAEQAANLANDLQDLSLKGVVAVLWEHEFRQRVNTFPDDRFTVSQLHALNQEMADWAYQVTRTLVDQHHASPSILGLPARMQEEVQKVIHTRLQEAQYQHS